jgi:hypothetical protein
MIRQRSHSGCHFDKLPLELFAQIMKYVAILPYGSCSKTANREYLAYVLVSKRWRCHWLLHLRFEVGNAGMCGVDLVRLDSRRSERFV